MLVPTRASVVMAEISPPATSPTYNNCRRAQMRVQCTSGRPDPRCGPVRPRGGFSIRAQKAPLGGRQRRPAIYEHRPSDRDLRLRGGLPFRRRGKPGNSGTGGNSAHRRQCLRWAYPPPFASGDLRRGGRRCNHRRQCRILDGPSFRLSLGARNTGIASGLTSASLRSPATSSTPMVPKWCSSDGSFRSFVPMLPFSRAQAGCDGSDSCLPTRLAGSCGPASTPLPPTLLGMPSLICPAPLTGSSVAWHCLGQPSRCWQSVAGQAGSNFEPRPPIRGRSSEGGKLIHQPL